MFHNSVKERGTTNVIYMLMAYTFKAMPTSNWQIDAKHYDNLKQVTRPISTAVSAPCIPASSLISRYSASPCTSDITY